MKIAILSNVNIDILPKYLNYNCYVGGYNQYMQEMLNQSSQLYRYGPEILILHIDGVDIDFHPLLDAVHFYHDNQSKTAIFVNTVAISPYKINNCLDTNMGIHFIANQYNHHWIKNNEDYIYIIDWQKEIIKYGYENIYDSRFWYIGRIPYSRFGMEKLAEKYLQLEKAVFGKSQKILILDLDNTLWGGIIGEDGINGIRLSENGIGKAYRDFQKMIKKLKDSGILLTIVSKNNWDDIKEVFNNHPMMILKENDFVSIKVNWDDKVQNIIDITNELNVGLNSLIFIDDNKVERERVKSALSDIIVPEFPDEPAYLPKWFSNIDEKYFSRISLTKEDKNRTKLYQAEKQRNRFKQSSKSIELFLKSLNMKMIIYKNHKSMAFRLSQLTQRTNQFNLQTKRYTKSDILSFIENNDYIIWDIELIDKFGTNGIVGLLIAKINKERGIALMDTFLVSCRVIGRQIENVLMNKFLLYLKKIGIKKVIGEYIPTKKNNLVKDFYNKIGFQQLRVNKWYINLDDYKTTSSNYIKIKEIG